MTGIEGSTQLPQAEKNRRELLDQLVINPSDLSNEEVSKLEDYVNDLESYVNDLNSLLSDLRSSRDDEDVDDDDIENIESDAQDTAVQFQKELKDWLIP